MYISNWSDNNNAGIPGRQNRSRNKPRHPRRLQPVFDAHHAVIALDDQIRAHESELSTISTDQTRLRENMKALKGSPEERALLTRYTGELNSQEDRLATLNKELAQLRIQRTTADQDFQAKLQSINLDETL